VILMGMRVLRIAAACAALATLGVAPSPTQAEVSHRMRDAEIVKDLRSEMDLLAAEGRFSGAVLLARDGQPLFEHAYGFADHAFGAPNKVDTKFNLASTTKVFTAVAILQLVEQGRVSLDETLARVLPDYPNQEAANKITILDLLGHKSGLGDFFGSEYGESNPMQYQSLRDYLPLFAAKPLLFEPGTKTRYSNAGFIVLGLVIEQLSGMSYYDYVRDHIFKPADMANTGFWSYEDDIANLALGYTRLSPGPVQAPGGRLQSANTPRSVTLNPRGQSAGSCYSSVEDLMRFSEALRSHKLLKQESVEMILSGGHGLGAQSTNSARSMSHAGGLPGANTYLEMYPDQGYAVVTLSNFDPPAAEMIAQRLRREIAGAELPRAIHLTRDALALFVGAYAPVPQEATQGGAPVVSSPNSPSDGQPTQDPRIEIAADREGLRVTLEMGEEHRFLPLSPSEFFDRDTLSPSRLTFSKDEKGRVSGLTITRSGPIQSTTAAKLP
jgi:CubicO group peptidase (beta-lactamase class C family)